MSGIANLSALIYRRRKCARWLVAFMAFVLAIAIVQQPGNAAPRPTPSISSHKNTTIDPRKKASEKYAGPLQPDKRLSPAARDAIAQSSGAPSQSVKQEPIKARSVLQPVLAHELLNRRSAAATYTQNANGSITERQYFAPQFFMQNGLWQRVNTHLVADVAGNRTGAGEVSPTFVVSANDWLASFSRSDDTAGMIQMSLGGSEISFHPIGASSVRPTILTDSSGNQTVSYAELWPGVDVEYVVYAGALKENIIIKGAASSTAFPFKIVGATLRPAPVVPHQSPALMISGALGNQFNIAPPNLILNRFGYVDVKSNLRQQYASGILRLSLDPASLRTLPARAFPAVIDPGVYRSTFGTRAGGNYVSFKTDGTICYSNTCNLYAGGLYDANGRFQYWRGAYNAPYSQFQNANIALSHANLHLTQRTNAGFWTGTYDTHTFTIGHATCLNSFNCVDGWYTQSAIGTSGDLDATTIYQNAINGGDWGAWLMVGGEDGSTSSFKNFDPDNSYVDFTYIDHPPVPVFTQPSDGQIFVDPQVSFKVNSVANPNNSTPLQYDMLISSGPGGVGTVIDSGPQTSPTWTAPDGVLQDGATYYVRARTLDPSNNIYSNWSNSISFKIDARTGKDKTQTADTLGPVSVDLATGNLSTDASSHTSAALGGSLGISLSYNSPVRSRRGLVGEYWTVAAGYGGGAPATAPNLTRVDQAIDFDWSTGSPAPGQITNDWYYARWTGYFVAPVAGSYQFGGVNDDQMVVTVNGQQLYSNGGCYGPSACYGSTSVSLTAGQVVPLKVEYEEATGAAYAHLYVSGAVPAQLVPQAWLQTGVRPVSQQHGLIGHYYIDDGSHNLDSTSKQLFLQRTDPLLSADWGSGSPIPGGPADNFMVRWTGYVVAPASGSYKFGTISDDGSRITLGTGNTQVMSKWSDDGGSEVFGQAYSLTANQPVPITVDYYEHAGGARMVLEVENSDGSAKQIVPTSWLNPSAQVLPDGWSLGIDPDGTVNYDHLKANQNSVVLTDSSGDTHEYQYQNGGYKPPVNEDAQLVRNSDGSFTLQDTDGQTYTFGADGVLTSVTSATDDRKPAALKYTYASPPGGGPVRIVQITDGVSAARYARVAYYGDGSSDCGTVPSGYDVASSVSNLLCAVVTNDGRSSHFYYLNGQLSRIALPGSEYTDYQYGAITDVNNLPVAWRLTALRDSVANDAIAANVRSNDSSVLTEVGYDALGRVTSVTQPAANAGDVRIQNTIEYLPGALDGSYAGATQQHVVGAAEPSGFTRRVEYDSIFRTTKDTDIANLSTVSVWDPVKDLLYSTTDPTGEMSTTIYDDEDRAISSYGPAPAAWFDATTRTPQAAYATQVPHSDTRFDGGITGAAVAWYNTRLATPTSGSTTPSFFGAPKLHTTGITPSVDPSWMGRDFRANPAPISVDAGNDSYGFSATGKLRLPSAGTFTLNLWHDDAARVWIDDTLVIDDWTYVNDSQNRNTASFTVGDTKAHRFRLDYANRNAPFALELWLAGPGISDASNGSGLGTSHWASYLSPDYSLETSSTTYDATIGNAVTQTSYGSTPELGLATSKTLDPTGLNYTSNLGYEAPDSGFLRQTSKTLPAGDTTTYAYYGATETADNPCTVATESYAQGGMLSLKTEPDPDGAGPQVGRTTQTVYDDAGRIVATRYNQDPWTCTYYNARGRVTETDIPSINGAAARTITNNWAGNGNPLITASTDGSGTVSTTTDLLGRTVNYTDAYGDTTTTSYDVLGRLSSETSPRGTITYVYDNYNRLTSEAVDGTVYALPHYDGYGRLSGVDYPDAGQLKLSSIGYDALGRQTGVTYTMNDGTTTSDSVVRSQSGQIVSGTENGISKSYSYDLADRLTSATLGSWQFNYSYATPTQCFGNAITTANRNSNVTSITTSFSGTATTQNYCYDNADRLYSSSDKNIEMPVYDAHGNTTRLGSTWNGGTTVTELTYDSSDRNMVISQNYGAQKIEYDRDVNNRVIKRWLSQNGTKLDAGFYDYTGTGDAPDYERSVDWYIIEKYFQLPGGVELTLRSGEPQAANRKVYSLPDLHGDIMRTADATGATVSDFLYSPYGQVLSTTFNNTVTPNTPTIGQPYNAYTYTSFSWVGKNQKFDESSFVLTPIQMGARVYVPGIGRFLQEDPQEGGTENNYVYPANPIGDFDLNGTFSIKRIVRQKITTIRKAAGTAVRQTVRLVATVPYAVYYAGYNMNRRINNWPILNSLKPAGWAMQGSGILGDAALDGLKSRLGFKESVFDEHQMGNMNPLHKPNAPRTTWLPGLHGSWHSPRVDWAW